MAISTRKLRSLLDRWTAAGLIEPRQAEALAQFEASRAGRFNPLAWLAAAGGACVATGIVLVISHNWESFGPLLKQAGFFLLLAAAALGAGLLERKSWIGPGLMLLWMGLPLAGIGLWGQIYHLSGDPLSPLLVWLALGLPLALFAWSPAPAFFHCVGLCAAAFVGAHWHSSWLSLGERRGFSWTGEAAAEMGLLRWWLNFLGILALWALAGWQAHRRLGLGHRIALLAAAALFAGSLGFNRTFLQSDGTWAGMLLACGLGTCFWFAARAWGLRGARLRELGFGLSAALAYAVTFSREAGPEAARLDGGLAWALFWALPALGLGLFGPWRNMELSRPATGRFCALLPLGLALAGLLGLPGWAVALLANFGLAALCVACMFEAAAQRHERLLDLSTLILGLLIFTRFIDYFGTLLKSGLGFIAAGLAFLGLAWALHRGRRALLEGRP